MLTAHHEYWTPRMLDRIGQFIAGGGNVVSVAGNLFAYRIDLDVETGITEVRKWPSRLDFLGDADKRSHIFGPGPADQTLTGYWRFVEQVNSRNRDLVLGTRNSLVVPGDEPGGFGKWCEEAWPSFLTAPPVNPFGEFALSGTTYGVAGHEVDEAVPLEAMPYVDPTAHWILATGGHYLGTHLRIDWDQAVTTSQGTNPLTVLSETQLDEISNGLFFTCEWVEKVPGNAACAGGSGCGTKHLGGCEGTGRCSTGDLVYFDTGRGGAVLALASSAAPWSVNDVADHTNTLVTEVLNLMLANSPITEVLPSCGP